MTTISIKDITCITRVPLDEVIYARPHPTLQEYNICTKVVLDVTYQVKTQATVTKEVYIFTERKNV